VPCWKNKKQPNMGLDNQLYVKKKRRKKEILALIGGCDTVEF
jgi:hypothetical protein